MLFPLQLDKQAPGILVRKEQLMRTVRGTRQSEIYIDFH